MFCNILDMHHPWHSTSPSLSLSEWLWSIFKIFKGSICPNCKSVFDFSFVFLSNNYQTLHLASSFVYFRSQTSRLVVFIWLYKSFSYVSIVRDLYFTVRLFDWVFQTINRMFVFVNNSVNFFGLFLTNNLSCFAVSRDLTD